MPSELNLIDTIVFIAVREAQDDGHHWADTTTISGSRHECEKQSSLSNHALPAWATMNPVTRWAMFSLTELE